MGVARKSHQAGNTCGCGAAGCEGQRNPDRASVQNPWGGGLPPSAGALRSVGAAVLCCPLGSLSFSGRTLLSADVDWMRECAVRCELAVPLELTERGAGQLWQFEQARVHLVDAHLAVLPSYADDCANCQEWKALAAHPEDLAMSVVPVLGREALLHRAAHLISSGSRSA